jgi:hypothetical protein
MKSQEFMQLLDSLCACSEAKEWAQGKSFDVVWTTCKRGDWLLWLCGKMANKKGWPTRKQLVLAACSCAETALKYVKEGEDRPRIAIETARNWARGKATLKQVTAAANAAYAAANDAAYNAANAAANAAYYVAANAAYAAANAAAYAAANAANAAPNAAYYATHVAANAAYVAAAAAANAAADADVDAANAAAYAAANAARILVRADCAKIVRRELEEPRP